MFVQSVAVYLMYFRRFVDHPIEAGAVRVRYRSCAALAMRVGFRCGAQQIRCCDVPAPIHRCALAALHRFWGVSVFRCGGAPELIRHRAVPALRHCETSCARDDLRSGSVRAGFRCCAKPGRRARPALCVPACPLRPGPQRGRVALRRRLMRRSRRAR
jgi:hypothetical protein